MQDNRSAYSVLVDKNVNGRDHLESLGVVRIILKWFVT
jgi:hypothetical protein